MNTPDHKRAISLVLTACLFTGIFLLAVLSAEASRKPRNSVFNSEDLNKISLTSIHDQPLPSPDLSPLQTIAIQLKALQSNDTTDAGILTTFNFAAPGNKAVAGNVENFKLLIKSQVYEPILNFRSYTANKIHIEGNEAQQIVVITDKNGNKAAYLFYLSKQTEGPLKNCWLTDGMIRLAYEEKKLKV